MESSSAAGRWIDRNAKLALLLSVVAFIVLAAGGGLVFLQWFDGYMRGLPAYAMAMHELRSHREASELLGPPIRSEGWVQGNFKVSSGFSHARMSIPVEGSRAKGRLLVEAHAIGDDWRLDAVTLQTASPSRQIRIVRAD